MLLREVTINKDMRTAVLATSRSVTLGSLYKMRFNDFLGI
jgi:hypothetical protein